MRDTALTAPTLDAIRPTRPAPKPRAGPNGATSRRKRAGKRRLPARLSIIAGSAGLCAIMIGIVVNATLFQKGHHPAPLFAAAPAKPAVVEPPPAAAAPPPPGPIVAPAPAAAPVMPQSPLERRAPPSPTPSGRLAAAPGLPKAAAVRHRDAIARLLGTLEPAKTGKLHAAAPARTATARPASPLAN